MQSFQEKDTAWTWVRRIFGIALLTYIVVGKADVDTWVFVLIAGLLGLPDVIGLQDMINAVAQRRNGKENS